MSARRQALDGRLGPVRIAASKELAMEMKIGMPPNNCALFMAAGDAPPPEIDSLLRNVTQRN